MKRKPLNLKKPCTREQLIREVKLLRNRYYRKTKQLNGLYRQELSEATWLQRQVEHQTKTIENQKKLREYLEKQWAEKEIEYTKTIKNLNALLENHSSK